MKTRIPLAAVALVAALATPGRADDKKKPAPPPAGAAAIMPAQPPAGPRATTELKAADGKTLGTVTVEGTTGGLLVTGKLEGVPPGDHAIHLHETGKCDAKDGFKSAGGHFNPHKKHHGAKNAGGMHAGDLPNLHVPDSGKVEFDLIAPGATLDQLLDADGAAVVVHAKPDDYATDPAGNAGDRVACGVLAKVAR